MGHNPNSFEGWKDDAVLTFLRASGIYNARKLPEGDWIGLHNLLFTTSVCMGVTPQAMFTYRWCFEDPQEAKAFLNSATAVDDIPHPEKRTSLRGHRYLDKPLLIEKDERGFDKW